MIQGAGSNVGKSLLVAGLCRAARLRGITVAPFKPQNMSNNAAVTADGGEIGRAQALQALAAGLEPLTDMNPVLLKPETDVGSQVIVQGCRISTLKARDYWKQKPQLMSAVLQSFDRLKDKFELVIVEGAGSPAEVNLRTGDIANMGFAERTGVPVVLIGDIDRGGVIAQIVGTKAVLAQDDADRIQGFIINKFRGDPSLFDDGYQFIAGHTGWRGYGVLPFFEQAWKLPAEDALDVETSRSSGPVKIAWLALSRVANFDDLDPLKQEPGITIEMVRPGEAIPSDARLVIIPGTKSTRGDLAFLRAQGWDIDLFAHVRRGGHVLGICGGYQMLGQTINDPDGIEGNAGSDTGLGLLDIETVMNGNKHLSRVEAQHAATSLPFTGYEIHIGRSSGPDCGRPFAHVAGAPEGAISADGCTEGTYLHGMFSDDTFRAAYLQSLGAQSSRRSYAASVETTLDGLAAHLEAHLDVAGLLALAR